MNDPQTAFERRAAERRAAKPRNRLVALLTKTLDLNPRDAEEVVSLLEEMLREERDDIRDEINREGMYDPHY